MNGKEWYQRHISDPYVKQAKKMGLVSRAAFKWMHINSRHKLITKRTKSIVELGASPGGWTQVIAKQIHPSCTLIAVDLLPPAKQLPNVNYITQDFQKAETIQEIQTHLDQKNIDLILSDMLPNTSGIPINDQANLLNLIKSVIAFANQNLSPKGYLLFKWFEGELTHDMMQLCKAHFKKCTTIKPDASRKASREVYILVGLKKSSH